VHNRKWHQANKAYLIDTLRSGMPFAGRKLLLKLKEALGMSYELHICFSVYPEVSLRDYSL
jgi:hypothetical protein